MRQKFLSSPRVHVAPARHALGRQADLVAPDGPGLLVVAVGRGRQALAGDAQVLRQELPGPVDGLALEVVAEGPVAQHLEEGVVARRAADLLEVVVLAGHAQAALRVHGPRVGALLHAPEDVLELDHAAVGEEQRLVPAGHQAGAGHDLVTARREEAQEAGTDLVGGQRLHAGLGRGPLIVVWHRAECTERRARAVGRAEGRAYAGTSHRHLAETARTVRSGSGEVTSRRHGHSEAPWR